MTEESGMEIDSDELREFLESDLAGPKADPAFKERLRLELLDLVRVKYGPPGEH